MAWVRAWVAHVAPPQGRPGFMYMLAGGRDAGNTDPYATKPEGAYHWINAGPHVMVVGADAGFCDQYPKSKEPDTTGPCIMRAGTPYQHFMAAVK